MPVYLSPLDIRDDHLLLDAGDDLLLLGLAPKTSCRSTGYAWCRERAAAWCEGLLLPCAREALLLGASESLVPPSLSAARTAPTQGPVRQCGPGTASPDPARDPLMPNMKLLPLLRGWETPHHQTKNCKQQPTIRQGIRNNGMRDRALSSAHNHRMKWILDQGFLLR